MTIVVREAKLEDAELIVRAHYSAVHTTAKGHYAQSILDEWSPSVTPERIGKFENLIKNPEGEIILVAELDGKVVGFGSIVPNKNELRALYVSADVNSKGAGSALIEHLESKARQLDMAELNLDSSITAEAFYVKHGYEIVRHGKHPLRSGNLMDCVVMKKVLRG